MKRNYREYENPHLDKSKWESGPWDEEPDKIQWIDDETGLDCLIVRNWSGNLCGYVGVGPDHPWHGLKYDEVDAEVHGGLTFSDECDDEAEECQGVCHVPEEGRPDHVWWLGFDCAHLGDMAPRASWDHAVFGVNLAPSRFKPTYKDVDYVTSEILSLAKQVREADE